MAVDSDLHSQQVLLWVPQKGELEENPCVVSFAESSVPEWDGLGRMVVRLR